MNSAISGAVTIISDSNTISYNLARRGGGGIYLNSVGSNALIEFISSNDVIGGIATHSTADAVLTLEIDNTLFEGRGGGIFMRPEGSIVNVSISDSNFSDGLDILDKSSSFTLHLRRNIISSGLGRGIYYRTSSPTPFLNLYGNTISGNWAFGSPGGGIYIDNASPNLTVVLQKNKILGNQGTMGGGVYINNRGSMLLEMINNIIATNKPCPMSAVGPENIGGGIYISDTGSVTVRSVNNTITGNEEGGIYIASSAGVAELLLRNDLIFGNTGRDIWNYRNMASISIAYSNIREIFGAYVDQGGNIDADPMFADPLAGDFRLARGSPCIDAGTSDGAPASDFGNDLRPQGRGFDIGADEYKDHVLFGDVNGDGKVDASDLTLVTRGFNTQDVASDINTDGIVDIFDLVEVGRNFGRVNH